MQRFIFALVLALAALLATEKALAGKRVALVIGNSDYGHAAPLKNPKNDAAAIADHLKTLDFEVVLGIDLSHRGFADTISEFKHKLDYADVALFFYAGHGLQVNGKNYLAPIDARLDDETSLDFEAIRLSTVLKLLENRRRTSIVFLDACRDNPLTRNLARGMGTRSSAIGQGLARVESGVGTLIAFATQPGNVALDGNERHSPFAKALLSHIATPGIDISSLMIAVRRQVIAETGGKQIPWEHSSLTAPFSFKPAPAKSPAVANASPVTTEKTSNPTGRQPAWAAFETAERINTCGAYKAFEDAYPDSFHSKLAWEWRNKNCKSGVKVASVQSVPTDTTSLASEDITDRKALAEALQRELNRVGCNVGAVDGDWGAKSRRALERFNASSGMALSITQPSSETLDALKAKKTQVCQSTPTIRKAVRTQPRPTAPKKKTVAKKTLSEEEKARAYRVNHCRKMGYSGVNINC